MVKLLGGGSSLGTVVNDMNSNLLEIKGEEVRKVIKDEQGTRVVVLDKDGLRTTTPGGGIDVMTADNADLTFNSSQNTFKVLATGTIETTSTVISNAGAGLFSSVNTNVGSYTHNLGFKPAVFAYAEFSNGVRAQLPYVINDCSSTTQAFWISYTPNVTSTQLLIGIRGMSYGTAVSTSAVSIKFYLMQETAG